MNARDPRLDRDAPPSLREEMSVNNARARFGSGGSRDLDEPIRLPQADPWDKRTGHEHLLDFSVDCLWIPVNEDWATLSAIIHLHDGEYKLSKDAEVFRVRSERQGTPVESPELTAIAWTKKMLGNGGVPVTGLYERNPGHLLTPRVPDGALKFRWWAGVASRYSVAVVRLGGDLFGQARLTLVE